MATYDSIKTITLTAGGDLSSSQYKFVTLDTDGTISVVNSTADIVVGILMNAPTASGQAASVAVLAGGGILKAATDGTVTRGAKVTCSSAGLLTLADTSTEKVLGLALETDGASGTIVSFIPVLNQGAGA